MAWARKLETLKEEVCGSIDDLSARSEFGLVAFSSNFVEWHEEPMPARPALRENAKTWVRALTFGGTTVLAPAGVRTLEMANSSTKRNPVVIVVSDGQPTDAAVALANITAANYQPVPVNAIHIGGGPGLEFLVDLTGLNGGACEVVY